MDTIGKRVINTFLILKINSYYYEKRTKVTLIVKYSG